MLKLHRIEIWHINKLVPYPRNPRKNEAAVDRMCGPIREFGFKTPLLARRNGEIVDGHLRLKAARKLEITEIPVILCDEWAPAPVKAWRILVNRSATWADFDLDLTGFNPGEIDGPLAIEDEERANAAVSRPGDLWLLGFHPVLCGDATSAEHIARLLADRKPRLLVSDLLTASSWTANGAIARPQWLRARRAELHEKADHRPDLAGLRRHARRMV